MSDIIDIADEMEGVHKTARIQTILNKARGAQAVICIDCEAVIPENRRLALIGLAVSRCIGCQELEEMTRRFYG